MLRAEFDEVWPAIREKFEEWPDGLGRLVNRRLERVRREAQAMSERNRRRATGAANARWSRYDDAAAE
jgi:hypothetical protein